MPNKLWTETLARDPAEINAIVKIVEWCNEHPRMWTAVFGARYCGMSWVMIASDLPRWQPPPAFGGNPRQRRTGKPDNPPKPRPK